MAGWISSLISRLPEVVVPLIATIAGLVVGLLVFVLLAMVALVIAEEKMWREWAKRNIT